MCLFAVEAATAVYVQGTKNIIACTLVNVGSQGASEFTATGASGAPSASLITTSLKSMILGFIGSTAGITFVSAGSGSILRQQSDGSYTSLALLNYQAGASDSNITMSTATTADPWLDYMLELIPA
jgi:hypothetical protein